MGPVAEHFSVAVVGAGWAGLSVSYALKQAGLRHVIFERARVCETWRTQRWSSFRMNTPNVMTVLPGDRYEGPDPEDYMTCEAFVAMVADYADRHALPVREHTRVEEVRREGGRFGISTSGGRVTANAVIVASGNLNVPRRPAAAVRMPTWVNQIDGSDYRNADGLPPGAVLVVGCGNSGGQIAEDLARSGRRVFLSTGRNGRVPRRYRGRDIFLWLTDTGRMSRPRTSESGRGLIGATHTISLQSLSNQGITLAGRLRDISLDGKVEFDDTLAECADFGDAMSEMLRQEVDEYICRAGIEAPDAVPDPAETVAPRFPDPPIVELDLATEHITSVVWTTGFTGEFGWLKVPGAIAANGTPVQDRSVSVPGVYFAGLDTSESLRAGTVLVAAHEADRVARHIQAAG